MDARADKVIPSQSVLMRFLVRSWEYRRPRLWVGVRVACGIFNVVLGVLLLASLRWLGPLAWLAALPLAGAVLIFWTVYRLQQDSVLRVRELEQSRAHAVDDSAARLRQIERDLHDGAQAQMVAVTMKLGLAMKKLGRMVDGTGQTDLDRVLDLVAAAHRGAKEAITELRDLARGIHPPLLLRRRACGQRRQAQRRRACHAGGSPCPWPAAGPGQRRRLRRRPRRGPRRPGRAGRAGRDGGRQAADQQPARRPHRSHR